MRSIFLSIILFTNGLYFNQERPCPIDLNNWKLELPTGYKASDWKLSNFQKDRFAKPFFYLDSVEEALVMEAYPAEGTSKAKYTRSTLREQMKPGSNDLNWTMKKGGTLEMEVQVSQMSKSESGKYHRTILMQVDGRTTADQTEELGLKKPVSMPFFKIYWENEGLRLTRRKLKDESLVGDALLLKSSWKEDEGIYLASDIGFEKVKIKMTLKKSKVTIQINDERPAVFRDFSVQQWYFENYFTVGNYLQSKDVNAHSIVKYYQLEVSHGKKK